MCDDCQALRTDLDQTRSDLGQAQRELVEVRAIVSRLAAYFERKRQTVINDLGGLEDALELERTIVPRRKRARPN
jgi:hypothetical protein